jgi:glutathione gamma-glutamylcysteinyltransferase
VDSFFPLVQHFQTQSEPASCALGTLCMVRPRSAALAGKHSCVRGAQVLNAMGIDPGLSWKGPWRWWSEEVCLAACGRAARRTCGSPCPCVATHTRTRTQVLLSRWDAATASLPADQRRAIADVRGAGMSLAEFASLSRATGLHTIERHADTSSLAEFQEAVWQALGCGVGCNTAAAPGADHRHTPRGGRGGTHVVVSFNRAALKQTGEGHFSPLGGYSRRHAAVLVMDVARFKYPPYWVSLPALWEAMQPPDPTTGRPRGYVVLKAATIPRDSDRCPLGDVQLDARPSPAAVALGRTHAHHRQLGHPGAAARLRAHLEGCTHGCP